MSLDITGFVIEGDPEITEHLLHPLGDRWLDSIGSAATTMYCTAPSSTGALPSPTPSALSAPSDGRCIGMANPHAPGGVGQRSPDVATDPRNRGSLSVGTRARDDVLPYFQTTGSAVTVSGHACQVKAPRNGRSPAPRNEAGCRI